MKKTNKLAALGLAAGLAAGGAAGLVVAVPAVSGAQSTDTTTADGSTGTESARPDKGARVAEALAPLVADGTLTQEQADKVAETLADAMPEGRGGPGMRRGGPGLDAAATALGITADELRTELESGQTIAQVAEEKGVDVQTVVDAMVAQAKSHLDEEVASGEHTQEEADEKLADITERITDSVNNGMPARGEHGPGGQPPADDSTDTTTQG